MTRRNEGNGAVGKDDTRQSKKRKQNVDDVEQGVQDLDIRNSHSTNNPSSRNKRKRQTEGASTRPKGPTTTTKGKLGTLFYGPLYLPRVVAALAKTMIHDLTDMGEGGNAHTTFSQEPSRPRRSARIKPAGRGQT